MFKKIWENSRNFDIPLFAACFITTVIGIVLVLSATSTYDNPARIIAVQCTAFFIGIVLCVVIAFWDYEFLAARSVYIFGVNIFLLGLTLLIGTGADEVGGNSWIRYGFIGIQPSELVKIGFIICFAYQLNRFKDDINNPKNVFLFVLHIGIVLALILMQPDFGTAMVFVSVFAGMLFVARISYKYIIAAVAVVGGTLPLIWMFFLENYQKYRILVFLNPEMDPQQSGYQVIQSKLAVSSGQFFGTGLFKGVQNQLELVPAKHTDFIFSIAGEELGFAGCAVIIFLMIFIICRCFYIAQNAKNPLGAFIAVGVGAMYLSQTFENIGMTIGLMPVTGITLPFLSYGGSSLMTNFMAIGLVLNVRLRHKVINF